MLKRANYTINLGFHYVDMCNLNETNPFVYNCFKKGGFTVSLSGNVHSQISTNQSIETTINLFSKKTGGLSGITEDEGVSEQWISINQFISALQQHQDAMLNRNIRNQGY